MKQRQLTRMEAVAALWKRGELGFKIRPHQKTLYETLKAALKNPDVLKYVINVARRFGKSHVLCLIAIEFALQNPGAQVRLAAPTAKALRKITHPIFRKILADCPSALKPEWKGMDGFYAFPNGAEIHVSGADNGNAENLRGTASDLNIVDEGGFVSELNYLLDDVLIPQTLTTGGKTLISSTPPRTPAHDYFQVAQEAMLKGNYIVLDIFQNTSISDETRDKYAKESGGYESTTFLREYRCQFVTDKDAQVIPEWQSAMSAEVPRDEFHSHYHRYQALDLGVRDSTVCLFAYYDFRNARLVIEDEFAIQGAEVTTGKIAEMVRAKEKTLWGDATVHHRICDSNDLIFSQSIGLEHGLYFIPTSKDSLHAMVNKVRMLVQAGRLVVSPRCSQLIGCLQFGVWTEDRKQFARSKVYGHFDALAALVYLIRNLDESTNPIPASYGYSSTYGVILPMAEPSQTARALGSLFNSPGRTK